MSVVTRTGAVLLNPHEKRNKFFAELQKGVALTNTHNVKKSEKGRAKKLTKEQRAYRAGYIQAQNDAAACFNAKNKKKRIRK